VIEILVGNPQPASRTRLVAEELAAQLTELVRERGELGATIDLADHASRLFEADAPELDALVDRVRGARVLVVASPTYKAAYTGLLKAFLDRLPGGGLEGVTAVPVMTIGAPIHALAVEHTLRPLLVELGASVPTRGLAFPADRVEERATVVAEWLARNGAPVRTIPDA
jgi:FMN reductase